MPLEFTNYVFRRSYSQYDHAWRRFLDIIHHRMLTLFYRAAALNEQAISFDRPEDDPVGDLISGLAGMPPDQVNPGRERELFLQNACHFALKTKTRGGLEDLLRHLFRVRLEVRDFVTASYDISPDIRAILGSRETSVLGINLQIGRTYFSSTQKLEIRIGPEDFSLCRRFFPGSPWFRLLQGAVQVYLDRPMDYDLTFIVKTSSIPPPRLGGDGSANGVAIGTAQLGSCWLGTPQGEEAILVKTVYAAK
jgi:type VI secretion system ImpH/TssG family protein